MKETIINFRYIDRIRSKNELVKKTNLLLEDVAYVIDIFGISFLHLPPKKTLWTCSFPKRRKILFMIPPK